MHTTHSLSSSFHSKTAPQTSHVSVLLRVSNVVAQPPIVDIQQDVLDSIQCGKELVNVQRTVHAVSQVIPKGERTFHVIEHVNFLNLKGTGLQSHNQYTGVYAFNSPSNFDTDGSGHATETTAFRLVSTDPETSGTNLMIHAFLHVTINTNRQITSEIQDLCAVCH